MEFEQEIKKTLAKFKEMDKDLAEKIVRDLTDVINPKFVSKDWAARVPYSRDQTGGGTTDVLQFQVPDIVVIPDNVGDVAYTCQVALKYGVPVLPVSTGANVCGMAIPIFRGIMIDFKRMNRILEIDEDGLTITVEPYVNYSRVQAELKKLGLRINVPGAPNSASVLSNNFFVGDKFFSSKFGYGPLEICGTEIVLPNGKIIRTGSLLMNPIEDIPEYIPGKHFEPKKGQGRVCVQAWGPDMTGLPYQGIGGNGIVTKLCIKVYKQPEKSRILTYGFKKLKNLARCLAEICGRDIGYGGVVSGPQYTLPTILHSNKDVERMNDLFQHPYKAFFKVMIATLKKPKFILKKQYREILFGLVGVSGRNFSLVVLLFGTQRKIELDYKRIQQIFKNKSFTDEKPGNGTNFTKHMFWKYNEGANPYYLYEIFKAIGMKDFRYDWLLRMGNMWDYNETPTRIMRKASGFVLQSPRMPFGKMHWAFDIFIEILKKAGYPHVDEGNWSTYINSGSGAHYACLELDMIYDPKSQEEKDLILQILSDVTLELMKKGIFFPHNLRLVRDIIEPTVMPKVWKLTKEIREALQATVLSPL
ncbi:MAG: FAD-binding oxidoreductase [Candidatus Helarchaeota archaeon]